MTAFPRFHQRYGLPSQLVHGGARHVCLHVPYPDVETPVIVPPPAPSYTLAPGVGPLTLGQQSTLDACLVALTGRVGGVFVTSACTTGTHHAIELATPVGTLLALERAAPAGLGRAAPRPPVAGEMGLVGPGDADA